MSFTREKREAIRHYLLEKIDAGDPAFVNKAAEAFQASNKTIYRYLQEMTVQGLLQKEGAQYRLQSEKYEQSFRSSELKSADEDRIFRDYIRRYVQEFPDNVRDIWYYAFTEMMNNAIDHSQASLIRVTIQKNSLHTTMILYDDGIGIFKKIKEHFAYDSLEDAIEDLFKGKLTTDPDHHTGEGIFFTSRMLDMFAVISNGKVFSRDKYDQLNRDVHVLIASTGTDALPGTFVFMRLSNKSQRSDTEVFDEYADTEGGFTRTKVPMKNIYDSWPVSRSQAKRLCRGFELFREVELDFAEIPKIGQGFAHELFVVWQKSHPGTRLIPVGANDTVQKMITHVKRG